MEYLTVETTCSELLIEIWMERERDRTRRERYREIGRDGGGEIFFDRNGNFERNRDLSRDRRRKEKWINRDGDRERSKEKGDRRRDRRRREIEGEIEEEGRRLGLGCVRGRGNEK